MSHLSPGLPGRRHSSIVEWFQTRIQECVHCTECQNVIIPFTSHCPKCGQANPAKVSISAALYLALGFAFLTFTLAF
jgi:hypothetical protein